ncbi:MAG: hypothetical protein ACRERU_12660 [Methylococcales bacterium]
MVKSSFIHFLIAFVLCSCSTLPGGPSVLVLPGTGKDLSEFRNDDVGCRQLAHGQIARMVEEPDSDEEGQPDYDIVYVQCMYGKGHRVPVPKEIMYYTRQEWHPPPPPNMPAPARSMREPTNNFSR